MIRTLAHLPAILCVLLVPSAPAQEEKAGVLSRIDRTLVREPAYQSDAPQYGLLVYGAEGKTRVWLVVDGDTLYVDRNGNGNLTDPGESVSVEGNTFEGGALVEANGTRHPTLRVRRDGDHVRITTRIHGLGMHYVGTDPGEPLRFAYRPEEAPIVHLGGPMTLRFYKGLPSLTADRRSRVNVMMGTPGLGKGTFAAIRCDTVLACDANPVADIAFPHKDSRRGPILIRVPVADD